MKLKFLFCVLIALMIYGITFCEKSSFAQQSNQTQTISINGTKYVIPYSITVGKVLAINADTHSRTMVLDIQSTNPGNLTITLPRILIDAKENESDTHFIILANGHGPSYKELLSPAYRTLTISFLQGTNKITITGTQIVPEYGLMPLMILTISVLSIFVILKFRTFVCR